MESSFRHQRKCRTPKRQKYAKAIAGHPLIIQAKADAIAAQKSAEAAKLGKAKALASNQAAADKGDAYGLMRMGERYRDGEGVEKDLAKAKEYFQKAANAGSETAAKELSKLNPQSDNKIGN